MEQMLPLLEKLATSVGTTVAHLWAVLTLQAWIVCLQPALWIGGLLALSGMMVWIRQQVRDDDELRTVLYVLRYVFICACIVPFAVLVYQVTIAAFNPEAYALEQLLMILKMVK